MYKVPCFLQKLNDLGSTNALGKDTKMNSAAEWLYDVLRLQRIHCYNVLVRRSWFHVMKILGSNTTYYFHNVHFSRPHWECCVTRLECTNRALYSKRQKSDDWRQKHLLPLGGASPMKSSWKVNQSLICSTWEMLTASVWHYFSHASLLT